MSDDISGQSGTDRIPHGAIFESNSQFRSNIPGASNLREHADFESDDASQKNFLPATRRNFNFEHPSQTISKIE